MLEKLAAPPQIHCKKMGGAYANRFCFRMCDHPMPTIATSCIHCIVF